MPIQFFGQFLLEKGFIKHGELLKALERQQARNQSFGQRALQHGLLSSEDIRRITTLQLNRDIRFGEAALDLGLLSAAQVKTILELQEEKHVCLGEIILEMGFVSRTALDEALHAFEDEQRQSFSGFIRVDRSVPLAQLATDAFALTHRSLLRMWGIHNKLDAPVWDAVRLSLPAVATSVEFSGDVRSSFLLGVDQEVAKWGALQFLGSTEMTADLCRDLTRELANVVCGNLVALLSKGGLQVNISVPVDIQPDVALDGHKAIAMRFATPYGDVHAAVTYRHVNLGP